MKTFSLTQLLAVFTLLIHFVLVSCAPSVKCNLPAAPLAAPEVMSRGLLPDFYFQCPSKQPPSTILDRLISKSTIIDKITLYRLAVEGRNTSLFNQIFTSDAVVDFSLNIGQVRGAEAIGEAVLKAVEPFDTAPIFGPQIVRFSDDDPCTASSLTAFFITFYGKGEDQGKSAVTNGEYRDRWQRDEAGDWFILTRNFVYSGYPLGNLPLEG